jgi:putative membrane protein
MWNIPKERRRVSMTTRKKQMGVLAAGLTCVLAAYALAQQVEPGQAERTRGPSEASRLTGRANPDVDRFLAACWQAKNQAEIEISKVAQQKAENPEVKQFAGKMVKEHGQLTQKLEPLAAGERAEGQNATANAQAISQLIAIEQQIVEQNTELMRQKLDEKSGAEFDQCYVGGQIGCHMQASAALGVISQQASGQLKQLASQAKQTVDHHLKEAEQLAKQLAQQSGNPQASLRDRNLRPASAEQ